MYKFNENKDMSSGFNFYLHLIFNERIKANYDL